MTSRRHLGCLGRGALVVGLFAAPAIVPACSCQGDNIWEPDGDGDGDSDADEAGDGDAEAGCAADCGEGRVCRAGECVDDLGPCEGGDDCDGDSCCAEGRCVPFGSAACGSQDPTCAQPLAVGLFQPALQCEWTGPPAGDPYPAHVQVLGSPAVVDFHFAGDPDTAHPSIVFNSYDGLDGGSGTSTALSGVIRVIDGRTCELQHSIGPFTNGCDAVALGDLDGDGRAEVVAFMADAAVEAFRWDATSDAFARLWESHDGGGARVAVARGYYGWTGPAIADLDDDGSPEVIADGAVLDATGLLLDATAAGLSAFSVVADLDVDGTVELATGAAIFGWDRAARAWVSEATGGGAGYVAVADFGTFPDDGSGDDRTALDGIAEVAVVNAGLSRIETALGRAVFGPVALPGSSGGGPPTVGDFDGDGLPELAAAASDSFTIFDPDCLGASDAARCNTGRADGILWSQPSQDHSSNITGSSIFDFDGDGRAEAVYADEIFVRVYDGRTGEVVFSTYRTSCTWNENPIVADVDGDFNAELVIPSNESCDILPTTMGGLAYETDPSGRILDPLFAGLRCEAATDCASGRCESGFCRCDGDADCGGGSGIAGFVCAPPPGGTPGSGASTCRAAWLGEVHGIRVYRDQADRWVSSRTIWNQHAYAVTGALGSGAIPRTSEQVPSWADPELNSFRMNVQGEVPPGAASDLTARSAGGLVCDGVGTGTVTVAVCNRGAAPAGAGIPVTFYVGDPSDCAPIPGCTVETTTALAPGACTPVSCVWVSAPTEPTDVWVVADDDGSCTPAVGERECHEGNNGALLEDLACAVPG